MSARTIVVWCPDWPVTAAAQAAALSPTAPLAVIDKGRVVASSSAARRDGVRRGLRLREAQSRCTELIALPYEPAQAARAFDPVLRRLEDAVPGVMVLRPGTCALRARGPSRYYGSEEQAAAWLLARVLELGIPAARIGVADGVFAAEQAARAPGTPPVRIIPPEASPLFLAPLPVSTVVEERLATLLHRLGVHTLGAFAALPPDDVRQRFGAEAALAQEKAAGRERHAVTARVPPRLFDELVEFEPALDQIDLVTFGIRQGADRFIDRLSAARLVCTAVRVEMCSESGERSSRVWLHPRWFTAADVVDRVRWQLQGDSASDSGLRSGIVSVQLLPDRFDSTGNHEPGLWGSGADERIHHSLSRLQSLLGHEGVLTAVVGGGRLLRDRHVLVPWGDSPPPAPAPMPWPGHLPGLVPATVYRSPLPVTLRSATGATVTIDDRGTVSNPPVHFAPTADPANLRAVVGWSGPWPVVERWWEPRGGTHVDRLQVLDDRGDAWLLNREGGLWWAEGHYD